MRTMKIRHIAGSGGAFIALSALTLITLHDPSDSARAASFDASAESQTPAENAAATPSMLRPVSPQRAVARDDTRLIEHMMSGVLRSRQVEVALDVLPDPAAASSSETPIRLELFDDLTHNIRIDSPGAVHPGAPDVRTLLGHVDGREHDSWVVISRLGDDLHADIVVAGSATVQLRSLGGGVHEVREVDESNLPPCGVGLAGHTNPTMEELRRPGDPAHREDAAPATQRGEFFTPVDVLMVYTPAALATAGSPEFMELSAVNWFETTNFAYENSGVEHRLRMVGLFETDYVEIGASADLGRLRNPSDGYMDEVHELRDLYGADLVHLISMSTGACGVAYVMPGITPGFESSAFGLTRFTCGALTFAHEIGHNMGCGHDKENANFAAFCYSYGYRTPNNQYRTIMAYSPGTRLSLFSSPDVMAFGFVFGVDGDGCPEDAADNVRTMNETSPTVANFRDEVTPTEPSAFSVLSPVIEDGSVTTLTPTLTWSISENAGSYSVVIAADEDLENVVYSGNTVSTQFNIPNGLLQYNTRYYWQVTAINNFGMAVADDGVASLHTRHIADFNLDSAINSADLAILLGSWGACSGACLADITGTGFIGSDDLSILLGSWGPYVD